MFDSAPIIKARQHWFVVPFFKLYTIIALRRRFYRVIHKANFEDQGKPLLILCNHISWWDGFWVNHWNTFTFKRRFYFMMLEEQLKKFWFFRYTGAFSINPQSRSMFHSLSFCSNLLSDKENMVLLFPQGEIRSIYSNDFRFKRGIKLLLQRTQSDFQILFMSNFVEYGSNPKPTLLSFVEGYEGEIDSEKLELAYFNFYERCRLQKIKSL